MSKVKRNIGLISLLVALILGIVLINSSYVRASDTPIDLNEILNGATNVNMNTNFANIQNSSTVNDSTVNNNTINNTNFNAINNTANVANTPATRNSLQNDLPSTGIEDSMFFVALIAVIFIVIYAYKKVRDYRS